MGGKKQHKFLSDSFGFHFSLKLQAEVDLKRREGRILRKIKHEKSVWRQEKEWLGGTENPTGDHKLENSIGDHKFVVAIFYGF